MEQYVYTFFHQKVDGNKSSVIEWTLSLINSISNFKFQDDQVMLFAKILKNECDEEFYRVQEQVRDTVDMLLNLIV